LARFDVVIPIYKSRIFAGYYNLPFEVLDTLGVKRILLFGSGMYWLWPQVGCEVKKQVEEAVFCD
jgi:hypothetical protein